MFSKPERGRRSPHVLLTPVSEDPIRPNEARMAAWALALGQEPGSGHQSRRPHRGMLPDVDFSRAVRVPRRPGLVSRLFRLIIGRKPDAGAATDATATESGADDGALGAGGRKPYLKLPAGDSDAARPATPASLNHRSRAA
ncbi:hypothetical protein ACSBOB_12050 [Mesorhizobium sp. ASY16-5R]|uniref:hypothetical protein n=1 Tax=Mesorhizobium sp. ASY16-5R TaxID=3445772 RepID=UPI003FA02BBE